MSGSENRCLRRERGARRDGVDISPPKGWPGLSSGETESDGSSPARKIFCRAAWLQRCEFRREGCLRSLRIGPASGQPLDEVVGGEPEAPGVVVEGDGEEERDGEEQREQQRVAAAARRGEQPQAGR